MEQKWWNKNGRTKIIHYSESPKQKIGGDSASAKRSAEQKLVGGTKKWSVEQKLVNGTRTAEQKLVSGTKTAGQKRQNKNYSLFRVTQTKIGGGSASAKRSAEQKLVGTVGHWVTETPSTSAKRSAEQKLPNKKLQNKNWWGLLAIG